MSEMMIWQAVHESSLWAATWVRVWPSERGNDVARFDEAYHLHMARQIDKELAKGKP